MIRIDLGEYKELEYDVRALTASFFPGEEIVTEGEAERTADIAPFTHLLPDKNALKRALYERLSAETGRKLPWGILTGIRPTKLTSGYLAEGMNEADAAKRMSKAYLVSEKKAELSARISSRERSVLASMETETSYSLYIGIPFCPTTCLYCSFTSYPLSRYEKRVDEYLECVFKELDWTAERFRGRSCLTVYIGGGTPSTLSPEQLDRLITRIEDRIDLSHIMEFTVECGRPDSITEQKLRVLREHGVTRISVNPQTMNDGTLALIGRKHDSSLIKYAYALARDEGFDNINMDIILGLPGESEKEVAHTMEEIGAMAPDSLTVHALAIKRASRLKMEAAGAVKFDLTPDEADHVMDIATRGAEAMGLEPYYLYRQKNMAGSLENVGFARPGTEGLYNILIMEELHHIIALGAGTVTKGVFPGGRIDRVDNVKTVEEYIGRIDEMIERKRRLFDDTL